MLTKFEIYSNVDEFHLLPTKIHQYYPYYVLGKRIDVPSCNVEFNERKVDWHDARSLGNLFWLHST